MGGRAEGLLSGYEGSKAAIDTFGGFDFSSQELRYTNVYAQVYLTASCQVFETSSFDHERNIAIN